MGDFFCFLESKLKIGREVMSKMPEKCRKCCSSGIFVCNDCTITISDWGTCLEEEAKKAKLEVKKEESILETVFL